MPELKAKVAEHSLEVCEGQVFVFVDGVYRSELSQTSNLAGKGWKAGSIRNFQVSGCDIYGDELNIKGLTDRRLMLLSPSLASQPTDLLIE